MVNSVNLVGLSRIWSDLVGLGRIWSHLVTFGHIWSDLVGFGRIWSDSFGLVGFGRCNPWEGTYNTILSLISCSDYVREINKYKTELGMKDEYENETDSLKSDIREKEKTIEKLQKELKKTKVSVVLRFIKLYSV